MSLLRRTQISLLLELPTPESPPAASTREQSTAGTRPAPPALSIRRRSNGPMSSMTRTLATPARGPRCRSTMDRLTRR